MTIQIPDDLARGLEGIAAAQSKSVEQVALESLRALFEAASSPEAVLRSVRRLPHPSASAVDDFDAAIVAPCLPTCDQIHWTERELESLADLAAREASHPTEALIRALRENEGSSPASPQG